VDVSFTITNIGDNTAHDVRTLVDFGSLTVSNVSSGATYNAAGNRFERADSLTLSPDPADGRRDLAIPPERGATCPKF
jgi:hypothetical protein